MRPLIPRTPKGWSIGEAIVRCGHTKKYKTLAKIHAKAMRHAARQEARLEIEDGLDEIAQEWDEYLEALDDAYYWDWWEWQEEPAEIINDPSLDDYDDLWDDRYDWNDWNDWHEDTLDDSSPTPLDGCRIF